MGEEIKKDLRNLECVANIYGIEGENKDNLIMSLINEGYFVGITRGAGLTFSYGDGWWITVCKEVN